MLIAQLKALNGRIICCYEAIFRLQTLWFTNRVENRIELNIVARKEGHPAIKGLLKDRVSLLFSPDFHLKTRKDPSFTWEKLLLLFFTCPQPLLHYVTRQNQQYYIKLISVWGWELRWQKGERN